MPLAYHKLEKTAILGKILVDQQLLQGITGCWVVNFAVHRQFAGFLDVGGGINVHVADAVCVAHDWDASVVLDVADQRIAAPWDDLLISGLLLNA